MKKLLKFVALSLCLVILLGTIASPIASASPPPYTNINFIAYYFDISSSTGKVTVSSTVDARNCTAIHQKLELQHKNSNGGWDTELSSTYYTSGDWSYFAPSGWYVSKSGYQVAITVTIYNGSSIEEQVTVYTYEK